MAGAIASNRSSGLRSRLARVRIKMSPLERPHHQRNILEKFVEVGCSCDFQAEKNLASLSPAYVIGNDYLGSFRKFEALNPYYFRITDSFQSIIAYNCDTRIGAKSLKMGNDGGSIPTRRELVKEAARDLSTTQVKEIQTEQQEHYWSTCALSHQPLSSPVVSDALGTLYNKDAVLDHLLSAAQEEKKAMEARGEAFKDRLRSLKDVVEVKFQVEVEGSKWVCPVTGKVLGPGVKAVYLVPCGHAFSESAMKEMPGDTCLQVRVTRSTDYKADMMS